MKYIYILKLFFYKENGKFRYSYLLPISSILIGSYMIFMILCIMNCMEEQLGNRLNAVHYKYYVTENQTIENVKLNKGLTKLGYTSNGINDGMIYIHGINNFKNFKENKIINFILDDHNESGLDFFIGDDFARRLNIIPNDTIKIYYPTDVNIVFNTIPYKKHVVTGIFDTDLLNYDNNTILTSLKSIETNYDSNYRYYFDSDLKYINNIKYEKNPILNNMVISALKIEKRMYYFFGIFVVIISCFMFFLTLVQSINEKSKGIFIFRTLGLNIKYLNKVLIFNSLLGSIILSCVGFALVNFTVFLNIHYDMFEFLFRSIPFKVSYISIYNSESYIMFTTISLLSIISTYVSLLSINRFKLNNNVNT